MEEKQGTLPRNWPSSLAFGTSSLGSVARGVYRAALDSSSPPCVCGGGKSCLRTTPDQDVASIGRVTFPPIRPPASGEKER